MIVSFHFQISASCTSMLSYRAVPSPSIKIVCPTCSIRRNLITDRTEFDSAYPILQSSAKSVYTKITLSFQWLFGISANIASRSTTFQKKKNKKKEKTTTTKKKKTTFSGCVNHWRQNKKDTFLAHLSRWLRMSCCDHLPSDVRRPSRPLNDYMSLYGKNTYKSFSPERGKLWD